MKFLHENLIQITGGAWLGRQRYMALLSIDVGKGLLPFQPPCLPITH